MDNFVEYDGWLLKQGAAASSGFKKRWFVLRKGKLAYFDSPRAAHVADLLGYIDLAAVTDIDEGPSSLPSDAPSSSSSVAALPSAATFAADAAAASRRSTMLSTSAPMSPPPPPLPQNNSSYMFHVHTDGRRYNLVAATNIERLRWIEALRYAKCALEFGASHGSMSLVLSLQDELRRARDALARKADENRTLRSIIAAQETRLAELRGTLQQKKFALQLASKHAENAAATRRALADLSHSVELVRAAASASPPASLSASTPASSTTTTIEANRGDAAVQAPPAAIDYCPPELVAACVRCAKSFGFLRPRRVCALCAAVVCGDCSRGELHLRRGQCQAWLRACDACFVLEERARRRRATQARIEAQQQATAKAPPRRVSLSDAPAQATMGHGSDGGASANAPPVTAPLPVISRIDT